MKRLMIFGTFLLNGLLMTSVWGQTEHIVKLGTRMMSLEAVNSYPHKRY